MSINKSVSSEWKVLVSLFTNKIFKMLSHVVNICLLPDLWHNSLDNSYCTEMQEATHLMYGIYPFQKLQFTHYCTWDIDCGRSIFSCTHSAIVSHDWLHGPQLWPLFHLTCASVLGLFFLFLCFTSVPFHHASFTPLLPLVCWPWLFSGCSPIVRICNSWVVLCLYMLSNWRFMRCTFELFQRTGLYGLIYILFISESLDSLGQFMANVQKA